MEGAGTALRDLLINYTLISALLSVGSSQLFKTVRGLLAGNRPAPKSFTNYGGFPSSHSAFISACAVGAALSDGLDSGTFALAFVTGCILISDILRLRRKVELNGKEIDKLLAHSGLSREMSNSQFAGHTKLDVAGGILWGCVCAVLVHIVFA